MKTIATTLLLTLATLNANATKYVRSWSDLEDANLGISLDRTYSSHSLTNGSFGFGWCSELDTTIEPTRDGRLKLKNCLNESETVFLPPTTPTTPTNLAQRERKADRSPAFSARVGAFSTSDKTEQVEFKNGIYTQYRYGSPFRKFDQTGRLIEWRATNGIVHRVKRNVYGHPVFWSNNKGARVSITSDANTGRITSIKIPGRGTLRYQYVGENLVYVAQPGGLEFNLLYDDLHNLTQISSTEGFLESVRYDKLRDEVLSVDKRTVAKDPQ
jgi:hypothetical protein